jgi:hypothetical protein
MTVMMITTTTTIIIISLNIYLFVLFPMFRRTFILRLTAGRNLYDPEIKVSAGEI